MTMLAARAYPGETRLRLERVAVPTLHDGDVRVRVRAAGMTHGLLSLWHSGRTQLLPGVLGHEAAGEVAEVGPRVSRWRVGDRVRLHPTLTCRDCAYCRSDRETLCSTLAVVGHAVYTREAMPLYEQYHNGGLAEYLRVAEWSLDPLPDEVSFEVGARVHSLAIALRALRKIEPRQGETLVVAAATGATGAAVVKCAPLFGFARVIAIGRSRQNLARIAALEPGLVSTIALEDLSSDWERDDGLTERIRVLTGGQGADCLVDLMPTGASVTMQAIYALHKGGRAVLLGGNYAPLNIPYGRIMVGNYTITGSNGYMRRDALELLELLRAGRLDIADLFTHRFALADVNAAIDLVETRDGGPLFVTIDIDAKESAMSSERNQRVVYVGTNVGLFRATPGDNSQAYALEPAGLQGQTVVAVLVDSADPSRLYAGTRDEGVFRSEDGGRTWQESSKGMVYREVWSMAQHPTTGELYVGTQPPAIFKSTDRGVTWTNCRSFQDMEESLFWTFPRAPHIAHIKYLHVVPEDPEKIFGAVEEGWIVRSLDGGQSWETLKQGVAFDSHAVTTVPGQADVVLATSGAGVYRSDNLGERFMKSDAGIDAGFTGGGYMSPPVIHPDRPNVVFAAGAEVPPPFWFTREQGARAYFYRSDDQGRTWHKLLGKGAPTEGLRPAPRSCVIDPRDPDTVLFGLTDGSVWETRDGGESFQPIMTGLPGWISGLCVAYPSASAPSASRVATAHANGANGTAGASAQPAAEIGQEYEITITNQIDNPFIGPNGVTRIGDADVRIPNATVGQKYRVRVLALGMNQFTQRTEATIQTISGPE